MITAKKDVKITVSLKCLSNFWRTLKIPLNSCKINLILAWSTNCVLVSTAVSNQSAKFVVTHTKLYVSVVTLSTQVNAKLLDQLKWVFKRTIKWNKYQSKASIQVQNQYLGYFIDRSFQGVKKSFCSVIWR